MSAILRFSEETYEEKLKSYNFDFIKYLLT